MDKKIIILIIICIILGLEFTLYLAWEIKKKGLRKVVIDLIVYAESNFKYNDDKFNYCVHTLIDKFIPAPFSLFISDKMVCKFVQTTFDLCKKALDYQKEVK